MQETAMTSDKPPGIQDLGAEGAPPGCYYSTYLQLDRLLGSQKPASVAAGRPAHD